MKKIIIELFIQFDKEYIQEILKNEMLKNKVLVFIYYENLLFSLNLFLSFKVLLNFDS